MSVTSPESLSPIGEPHPTGSRDRLERLAWMVFELMAERFQGVTNREFDGVEDEGLIAALRACSLYTARIGCSDLGDSLVVRIEGVDKHEYLLQISPLGPRFAIVAARVRTTTVPMIGRGGREDGTYERMKILDEHSRRLKLVGVTVDRAFLVGMSLVIGFMDDQGDDPGEDARLAPLLAQVMPTADELREIMARRVPSSINYDDEVDLPY